MPDKDKNSDLFDDERKGLGGAVDAVTGAARSVFGPSDKKLAYESFADENQQATELAGDIAQFKEWTIAGLASLAITLENKGAESGQRIKFDEMLERMESGGQLYNVYIGGFPGSNENAYSDRLKDLRKQDPEALAELGIGSMGDLRKDYRRERDHVESFNGVVASYADLRIPYEVEVNGALVEKTIRLGDLDASLALEAIGASLNVDGEVTQYNDIFRLEGDNFHQKKLEVRSDKFAEDEESKPYSRNMPTLEEFKENIQYGGSGNHLDVVYPDMTLEQYHDYLKRLRPVVGEDGTMLANESFLRDQLERVTDAIQVARDLGPQYEQAAMALTLKGGAQLFLADPSQESIEDGIDEWRAEYKADQKLNVHTTLESSRGNVGGVEGLEWEEITNGVASARAETNKDPHKGYRDKLEEYENYRVSQVEQPSDGSEVEAPTIYLEETKVVAFALYAEERGYVEPIQERGPVVIREELWEAAWDKDYHDADYSRGYGGNVQNFFDDNGGLNFETIYYALPNGLDYTADDLHKLLNSPQMELAFRDQKFIGQEEGHQKLELMKNFLNQAYKQDVFVIMGADGEEQEVSIRDLTLRELVHSNGAGEPTLIEQIASNVIIGNELDIPKNPRPYKLGYEEGDSYYYAMLEEKYPRKAFSEEQVSRKEIQAAMQESFDRGDIYTATNINDNEGSYIDGNNIAYAVENLYPESFVTAVFDPRNNALGEENNKVDFESEARFVTLKTVIEETDKGGKIFNAARNVDKGLASQYEQSGEMMKSFTLLIAEQDRSLAEEFLEIPFYEASQAIMDFPSASASDFAIRYDTEEQREAIAQRAAEAVEAWKHERKVQPDREKVGEDLTELWAGAEVDNMAKAIGRNRTDADGPAADGYDENSVLFGMIDSYGEVPLTDWFRKLNELSPEDRGVFETEIEELANKKLDTEMPERENANDVNREQVIDRMSEDLLRVALELQDSGINYALNSEAARLAGVSDEDFDALDTDGDNVIERGEITEENKDEVLDILAAGLDHNLMLTMKGLEMDNDRGAIFTTDDDRDLAEDDIYKAVVTRALLTDAADYSADEIQEITSRGGTIEGNQNFTQNETELDILKGDGEGEVTTEEIYDNLQKFMSENDVAVGAEAIEAQSRALKEIQEQKAAEGHSTPGS